jgi:hypothetical protein
MRVAKLQSLKSIYFTLISSLAIIMPSQLMTVGRYQFARVPLSQADFSDTSAVYVILCDSGESSRVIDVGETGELGTRIDNHERRDCWARSCQNGTLWVGVYPMRGQTRATRLAVEAELRQQYNPPCGTP